MNVALMPRLGAGAVLAAAIVISSAAPALAQMQRTPRAYRALFDPTPKANSVQSLDVSGSLVGGYDTSVLATQTNSPFGAGAYGRQEGKFASASGGVRYSRHVGAANIFARAQSSVHYLGATEHTPLYTAASVGASTSMKPWDRGNLGVNGTVSYASHDRVHLLDIPAGEDEFLDRREYAVTTRRALRYGAGASLSQQLAAHTSVVASTTASYSDVASAGYNSLQYSGAIQFRRQLMRNATAYVGYAFHHSQHLSELGDLAPSIRHAINAGVDYGRALSLTRHTTLSMSTGSTFVSPVGEESTGSMRTILTASANLTHEMGRSWYTQAAYIRGVRFTEELANPVLSTTARGSLSGYLGYRTDLAIVGAYSTGSNATAGHSHQYDTYTGSAQLRFAVVRYVSAYTQYLYYHYQFHDGVVLLRPIPQSMNRQDIRAGISATLPLLR